MKDIFGYELEVGDVVAFTEPGYTYTLIEGTVIKITPKKLLISWFKPRNMGLVETYKFPKQLAKNVGYK
jgi:hypothetical protein